MSRLRLAAFFALAALAFGCDDPASEDDPAPPAVPPDMGIVRPLKIAVAANLPRDGEPPPGLALVLDKVNRAGGIGGDRPIELELHNLAPLSHDEAVALGEALLADPSNVAVIGPETGRQMLALGAAAIEHAKVMVSYSTTSGDVLRAYGGTPLLWRTKPTDILQAEWLVEVAARDGADRSSTSWARS